MTTITGPQSSSSKLLIYADNNSTIDLSSLAGINTSNGQVWLTSDEGVITVGDAVINGNTWATARSMTSDVSFGDLTVASNQMTMTGRIKADSYIQTGGTLRAMIGGPVAGTGHAQLEVDQAAALGGRLELALTNSYSPIAYSQVTVLTSSALNGTQFDSISGVVYASGRGFAVTYTANDVLVTAAMLGDIDLDGDVDDSDLGTLFSNYTGPVGVAGGHSWVFGDIDGDGDGDDSDLGTAFSNYTGPLSPTSVPEPGSVALLAIASGLAFPRRRRRLNV
ncbi:MAG: PEP-CTERM sorting domain-containing protein [Phycisphaeraceae bacterium]